MVFLNWLGKLAIEYVVGFFSKLIKLLMRRNEISKEAEKSGEAMKSAKTGDEIDAAAKDLFDRT